MSRAQRVAWWALPSLYCLWLYWYGLKSWFHADDFAWLSLHLHIHDFHDLMNALFAPMAQGTIRVFSERTYFLVLQKLFGYDALPFRLVAFAFAFADLMLLARLEWRLTSSRLAGFLAAIFWISNSSVASPMAWSSTFNELLCPFFLLASLSLLEKYAETGESRFYAWQCLTFLLGFGALELNVVYPAIALVYAFCCARHILWKTVPLFGLSAIYTLVHNHFAPKTSSGVYGMYWDLRIFDTLWLYLTWAMGAGRMEAIGLMRHQSAVGVTLVLLAGLGIFAAVKLRRGNLLPLLMVGWFLIVLGPVLPLREHITDYYLAIPMIGLAMLGGWACAECVERAWPFRATAAILACLYMLYTIVPGRAFVRWQYERSTEARDLFWGVARARELHPKSIILLKGMSNSLFWGTMANSPFRLLGMSDVFVTPDTQQSITPHPELGGISEFVISPSTLRLALDQGRAEVYQVGPGALRNITRSYSVAAAALYPAETPREIQLGSTLFDKLLGGAWYPAEVGFRWMGQRATVKLGGPKTSSDRLYISGVLPRELVENSPLIVTVSVDGQRFETFRLDHSNTSFEISTILPSSALHKESIEVELETDRTYTPPSDPRPLSIAVTNISIR